MRAAHRCRCHDEPYTRCPICACEYCPQTWPRCPRCAETVAAVRQDARARALIADAAQAVEEIDADELEAYAARIRAAAPVPLRDCQTANPPTSGEQEPEP